MNMRFFLLLAFLSCILGIQQGLAQDAKREYEQSIKKREIPTEILDSMEPFLRKSFRTKYYFQTDGEEESYEIKGRMNGRNYSIEYQKDGTLIDIEVLIDFEEIPEETLSSIVKHLEDNYDKYAFTRIQRQYYPQEDEEDAEEVIEDLIEEDFDDFDVRYELEVDTRSNNLLDAYEFLFDAEGKLTEKRKIIRRAEDNIFY